MRYLTTDITKTKTPALIAHGVNCQRKMGSGVAKALYEKWKEVRTEYLARGSMVLGDAQFIEVEKGLVVANCFTQRYYGRSGEAYATPEAIDKALSKVAEHALDVLDLNDIHIPKIGCGLGGLDWDEDVVPVLSRIEEKYGINFTVCVLY